METRRGCPTEHFLPLKNAHLQTSQDRGAMMKKLLLAAALLAAASMPTMAETLIDDPLHGFCNGCATNGTNTPILQGGTPLTGFGFNSSPPGLSGTMFLDILIPNNT